jgi:hypothetical protein
MTSLLERYIELNEEQSWFDGSEPEKEQRIINESIYIQGVISSFYQINGISPIEFYSIDL